MKKGQLMRLMLISTSALIIVGVIILNALRGRDNTRDVVGVDLKNGEAQIVEVEDLDGTKTMTFENLSLVPGDSCECVIKLTADASEKYDLKLDFVDLDAEKTLKDFVRVKIEAGSETVYDGLLASAIQKEDMTVSVDSKSKKNTELKLTYYMPLEVGNEAKNAEADFELKLTASNE